MSDVSHALPRTYWQTGAAFSPCLSCGWVTRCPCDQYDEAMTKRSYRYRLFRTWDSARAPLMIVGLNPSTATDTKDDPTIRRCIAFAQMWGFGGLVMTNAFAYRSTDPKGLLGTPDPVGHENDDYLVQEATEAGRVVLGWGSKKSPKALHTLVQTRGRRVIDLLRPFAHKTGVLGKRNADGSPQHPLFQATETPFVPMVAS